MPLRRKKWTEEEEEALISKYGELLRSGFLSKTKSRERKFEPIANHVNALFHAHNPVAYPWLWTWKDASTKVQNMRNQYLGVKAKVRRLSGELEEFNWEDGLSQWSNFLKYKEVFGDHELDVIDFITQPASSSPSAPPRGTHLLSAPLSQHRQEHSVNCTPLPGDTAMHTLSKDLMHENAMRIDDHSADVLLPPVKDATASMVDHTVLDSQHGDLGHGLAFDYDGAADALKDADEGYDGNALTYPRPKRSRHCLKDDSNLSVTAHESPIFAFIAGQFEDLNERAARREEKIMEREREWEKRQSLLEMELARQRQDWERERKEMLEMWRREIDNREVERQERERKWEEANLERREIEREMERAREKQERERMDWMEKMQAQNMQHQAAMHQIQLQIAQNQQNVLALLTGVIVQLLGHGNDFSSEGNSVSSLVSQLLHEIQTHGNAIDPCRARRGTNESSDSQFDTD
ncbi:hypothetical protein KP509_05G004400 [Ceratopteris richardii]|uniref:Uncharacterized protein n=1 Tax=Ceratopteris richardii TaxID=49495 RepID=A0A8T2UL37_CERRI|nr:hypothetical protein KP509_05G004400 [Ceratopteris richardii]